MSDAMNEAVLEARGLRREFRQGPVLLEVLRGVDLTVTAGERLAIIGASGSGKTTLLQVIGGLDRPTSGAVHVAGRDIHYVGERERGELRNRAIGFVYQFHHLLPEFSALENVAMPLLVRREPVAVARARAQALLERVGLGARLSHRPHQLSGGERQRAAVARALVTGPRLVLADEPTGNLDSSTGSEILDIMLRANREGSVTIVLVTHDPGVARYASRVIRMKDGKILGEETAAELAAAAALISG